MRYAVRCARSAAAAAPSIAASRAPRAPARRHASAAPLKPSVSNAPAERGPRRLPQEAKVRRYAGAARPPGQTRRRPLCDSKTCGAAAALRSAARARRRHEKLGSHARAEPRSRRKAPRRPCRGPSGRIQHIRGHHPARRIWRRHRDDLGPRPLDARGRSAQGARQGPSDIRSRRREIARPLASGAAARAAEGAPRQLAAHQEEGRGGAAGRKERRDNWLLIKSKDEAARGPRGKDILEEEPLSVATGRSMDEIAEGKGKKRVWHSNRDAKIAPVKKTAPTGKPAPRARAKAAARTGAQKKSSRAVHD